MKNNVSIGLLKLVRNRVGAFVRRSHKRAVSLFDSSVTSFLLKRLRDYIPYIQNRVTGTFFLTFGVYSALIALFKYVFGFGGRAEDIYSAVCISVIAIPLILSNGNISTMLMFSDVGRAFSSAVGIRLQSLGIKKKVGRVNVAFLAGMVIGTLTFIWSPFQVVSFILLIAVLGVIFTYPESSALFAAIILPFVDSDVMALLALAGIVAFLIKLFRGKRSITYHHHRMAALIFLLLVFCGGLFAGNVKYAVLTLMCFVVCASDGYSVRAEKAAAAAVAGCGCVSAMYVLFYGAYRVGMLRDISEIIDVQALALMCCAIITMAASFFINRTAMPGRTSMLCMLSMIVFLVVTQKYLYLAVSALCIIMLLFFYRRRASYAVFAVLAAVYAAWVWLGGSNRKAVDTVLDFMKDFELGEYGIVGYMISGTGLENGFIKGENFYGAVASKLGIIGLVSLITAIVMLIGFILRRKNGKGDDRSSVVYMRAWAPQCAVIALMMCGFGVNIWAYDSVYVLFWLLFGVSSSIASDSEEKSKRALMEKNGEMSKLKADITI